MKQILLRLQKVKIHKPLLLVPQILLIQLQEILLNHKNQQWHKVHKQQVPHHRKLTNQLTKKLYHQHSHKEHHQHSHKEDHQHSHKDHQHSHKEVVQQDKDKIILICHQALRNHLIHNKVRIVIVFQEIMACYLQLIPKRSMEIEFFNLMLIVRLSLIQIKHITIIVVLLAQLQAVNQQG